jgi:hypothetical protein
MIIPSRPVWALGLAMPLSLVVALAAGCSHEDGGPGCEDPCPVLEALRCGGSAIQRCSLGEDACLGWVLVEDCATSQRVCLDPGTGPTCGVLCTDQCSLSQMRCLGTVVQGCAPNSDDCLRWVDSVDCADATELCAVQGTDATCVSP